MERCPDHAPVFQSPVERCPDSIEIIFSSVDLSQNPLRKPPFPELKKTLCFENFVLRFSGKNAWIKDPLRPFATENEPAGPATQSFIQWQSFSGPTEK